MKSAREDLEERRDLTAIVAIGLWPSGPWQLSLTGTQPNKVANDASKWAGLMAMTPRLGALIFVEGRGKAERIRQAVLGDQRTIILGTADDVQAALEVAAKQESVTYWDWPAHVERLEGLAEIKEKEDMRR
ncbi:hypothetical protein Hden_1187 [Hyphomicrobium denitrificans ATCC 51888]|uniref:Uncharacterized protein n=1 Tax=Hyphomicrobium denitrificans (strain ATCC 51888 / DSM 1869 / NCIMB 11706 / TK 0415) TaxID=582899 RepID=D8JVW1_HYPDA|nr:hypothetical protein [Hyphomicrobium denitrificans]ADJ23000.1 hypothetical protein Hden_1187 [Hyphomicrobium denitrificans ATCC 51888]